MAQLSTDVRAELRLFAFYIANGTLDRKLLEPVGDYRPALFEYGSILERVFAIYTNVLDIGPDEKVTNASHATHRAAQYIRSYLDNNYVVDPPFEEWETELHL